MTYLQPNLTQVVQLLLSLFRVSFDLGPLQESFVWKKGTNALEIQLKGEK